MTSYLGAVGRALAMTLLVLHGTSAVVCAGAHEGKRARRHRAHRGHKTEVAGLDVELPAPYAHFAFDAKTGQVLHADRPDELRRPASLTKVMTLYLLFEAMEKGAITADTEMEVSEHAASQERTNLDLREGQTLTVQDAILALVTHSANDAAVVVAEALAGSEEAFAERMTAKARALGMNNTVYRNASGLPDEEQLTTARDQARLGYAIQRRFPGYYAYFSTPSFVFRGRKYKNHNKLLGKVEGVDGIKTGYTRLSRFNLITNVKREDRHVVAVVLGGATARTRDARMKMLIEHCFANPALTADDQLYISRPVEARAAATEEQHADSRP